MWRASADQDVADDVKLQGRKPRRQVIYLRHSVCVMGFLGEKKKDWGGKKKERKRSDNKHVYTCAGSQINRHRCGSSPFRSVCVALAHQWLMQPI